MTSQLAKVLENEINSAITLFCERIAEKYNLEKSDLIELWNGESSPPSKDVPRKIPRKVPQKTVSTTSSLRTSTSSISSTNSEGRTCPYVYVRKPRAGEVCGEKARRDGTHCSKHKNSENKQVKPKNTVPKPRPRGKKENNDLVMRENLKIGKWWHPLSKLVFKSKDEHIVVGKVLLDGKFSSNITEEDLTTCKKYGFIVEKTPEKDSEIVSETEKEEVSAEEVSEIESESPNSEEKTDDDSEEITEKDIENVLYDICGDSDSD